jgi:hypothetical protein
MCGQAGMHCCLIFLSSTGIWKLPPAQSRLCFCAVFQLSLLTGVFFGAPMPYHWLASQVAMSGIPSKRVDVVTACACGLSAFAEVAVCFAQQPAIFRLRS